METKCIHCLYYTNCITDTYFKYQKEGCIKGMPRNLADVTRVRVVFAQIDEKLLSDADKSNMAYLGMACVGVYVYDSLS